MAIRGPAIKKEADDRSLNRVPSYNPASAPTTPNTASAYQAPPHGIPNGLAAPMLPIGNRNSHDCGPEDDDVCIVGGRAILKGVIWPGMGLFDSASEDQRRRRNQRKDKSVLENMEISSQTVSRNEVVYNNIADLVVIRERDVFDPPSCDDSPVRRFRLGLFFMFMWLIGS